MDEQKRSESRRADSTESLKKYLKEIASLPRITVEEERRLGRLIRKGDRREGPAALRTLVEANLRFVVSFAKKYRGWLLAIARNRIRDALDRVDALKRGGDQETHPFSELAPSGDDSDSAFLPGRSTTPSAIASHRERADLMEEALNGLAEDTRDVVRLYLFEEQPMERVAAELGIATSTAWYRFRKGAALYAGALEALTTAAEREREAGPPAPRP